MPPEIVRPPYELEAPDNPEAERLQRERERIRSEEVLPLEQRLKQLEAIHSDLETYLAKLQISLRNVGSPSGKLEPPEENNNMFRKMATNPRNDSDKMFPVIQGVNCDNILNCIYEAEQQQGESYQAYLEAV